jgi:hypothetical protein
MAMNDKAAAETKARENLRVDREHTGFNWFGVNPPHDSGRGKHARPGCTYRGARRNAARAAGWPDRRRFRKEPRFAD